MSIHNSKMVKIVKISSRIEMAYVSIRWKLQILTNVSFIEL